MLMRPRGGVVHAAAETVEAAEIRPVGCRQTSGGAQQESGIVGQPGRSLNAPIAGFACESCPDDLCVEVVAAGQVEPNRNVFKIRQNFRLGGIPLSPRPTVLQFLIERVGLVHTFDVTPRARVPVPVPGAAYSGCCLDTEHR